MVFFAAAASCFGQTSYTATPITAPSGYLYGSLIWISDDGKAGFGGALQISPDATQCMTYQNGTMSLLPTPGLQCYPVGANVGINVAQLSGGSGGASVVVMTNGSNTVLTPPSGAAFRLQAPVKVNAQGQMATTMNCTAPAGYAYGTSIQCAYSISSGGTFTRLSDQGNGSGATAINANGDVAGWVGQPGSNPNLFPAGTHAVVWSHTGSVTDLTSLTSQQIGWPIAINSKGQVVLWGFSAASFFYDGLETFTLMRVANSNGVFVESLNDNGEAVGSYVSQSNDGLQHPFYYFNGTALDLNGAVTNSTGGAILTVPTYIGNGGDILVSVYAPGVGSVPNGVQFLLTPVKAASVTASPAALSFGYQTVGAAPVSQTIQVSATGNAAVSFTAAATSTGGWLSVTQSSGVTPASLTVSISPAGLAAGVYSGQIVLTANTAGSSQTIIPVSLTVIATQTITASVTSLEFDYPLGDSQPVAQTIQVSALGNAPVSFTADTGSSPWLSVTPSKGTTPATLTVSFSLAGGSTPPGLVGNLVLTPNTPGNAQLTIPVQVEFTLPPVSVNPTVLNFTYQIGGSLPAPQSIQVSSLDSTPVSFMATASVGNLPTSLSISPGGGTTPGTVSVSVSAEGLAPGTYAGNNFIVINGTYIPFTLTVTTAGQTPAPGIDWVVNAASFAQGTAGLSWFTIQGANLSNSTRSWAASDFVGSQLPTSLDGVSVTVNGLPAYPSYISPTQINALAPADSTTGMVQVQVTNGKLASSDFAAVKQNVMPGFFAFTSRYAAASHADNTPVGIPGLIPGAVFRPAAPGEEIQIFGTGFGPTVTAVPSGQVLTAPAALSNQVTVTIGGQPAVVNYAGMTATGLDQLNVTVPASLPDGDALIVASIGGASTQANLYITIKK
jgi:uncharacterized protein (TIGR03437 family)